MTKSKFRFSDFFSRSLVGLLSLIMILSLIPTQKAEAYNPACVPVADDWLYNNDGTPRTYQLGDEKYFENNIGAYYDPDDGSLVPAYAIGSRIRENSQYAFDKGLVPTMDGTYGYPGALFIPGTLQYYKTVVGPTKPNVTENPIRTESINVVPTGTYYLKYHLKFTCADHDPKFTVRSVRPDEYGNFPESYNLKDTLRDFLVDWNPGSTRPSHGIRVFSTGGSGTDFDRALYSN